MTNAEKKIFAAAYVTYCGDYTGDPVGAIKHAVRMIDSLNECNTSELNDHESRVFAEFRSNELPQDPEVDPPSNSSAL